jgi:tetratricopeptide (TPR) repeat protein
MGLFSLFTGKAPEELEQLGDEYAASGEFGAARVEYEKGLAKAERKTPEKEPLIRRLTEKLKDASESLARAHFREVDELAACGEREAARDLLELALDLSADDAFKADVREKMKRLEEEAALPDPGPELQREPEREREPAAEPPPEGIEEVSDLDTHFHILVSTLPEELKTAYESYGESFKAGYIALNQGDFSGAAERFEQAMEENPGPGTWIPLELATACMNLGDLEAARDTMAEHIRENPESLRSYHLLCDIFWAMGDYEGAVELLSNCPEPLKENIAVPLLLGETYYQAGRYQAAKDAFLACYRHFGETEMTLRALAKTHEAMGETETARDLYGQIVNSCAGCGARVDPYTKRRYAELSLEAGDTSNRILEMFLSLVREDPDNRKEYYDRIGRIYEANGNTSEARRYFGFSN